MVSIPRRPASVRPRNRFSELPLVDSATAMSAGRPNAATWRENTTSTPMSLHRAVTTAMSLDRQNAGSARRPSPGWRNSVAISCASVELPPAGRQPAGHVAHAGPQPGRVTGADLPPQRGDLGGLGHGRGPDLLHDRVQVAGARVEEGVQRLHLGRAAGGRPAAGDRRATGDRRTAGGGHAAGGCAGGRATAAAGLAGPIRRSHDVTTAIASPACTRMVSPGRAETNATLTSS